MSKNKKEENTVKQNLCQTTLDSYFKKGERKRKSDLKNEEEIKKIKKPTTSKEDQKSLIYDSDPDFNEFIKNLDEKSKNTKTANSTDEDESSFKTRRSVKLTNVLESRFKIILFKFFPFFEKRRNIIFTIWRMLMKKLLNILKDIQYI